MQAVILAAGKSTRTMPLTQTRPKPLLTILNRPLLEYNLDQLDRLVDEVILIVGYRKEMIMEYFGDHYKSMKLTYVEQTEQLGTGHAVQQVKGHITGRFLVINGDDLYARQDFEELLKHDAALLVKEVEHAERWGIVEPDGDKVKRLVEKPKDPPSNLGNIGAYVFDKTLFNLQIDKSERGEYEITDYVTLLASQGVFRYVVAKGYWIPIGYPWQILDATEFLIKNIKESVVEGTVEDGVTLKGIVKIGKGAIIKTGAYIEGPVVIGEDCKVGPNCYIRAGTVLGRGCKVGNACEVKNSTLGEGTSIGHLSYVGDSVIGDHVNFGAGTVTANLRHDNGNVQVVVKGAKVDSGRRKLGAMIGDRAKTGIHTSIYPGRMIFSEAKSMPGDIVKYNLGE